MRALLVSPSLSFAIVHRDVIVALELVVFFVFNSHAEEKDVRKNNKMVDEKKNCVGEVRDDNHLRPCLKTEMKEVNLCRHG
jgi:hypothetical protein